MHVRSISQRRLTMAIRFLRRRPPAEPSAPPDKLLVAPRPSGASRAAAPFLALWRGVQAVFAWLDEGFSWFAVPFGARIRDPLPRYGVMFGMFALIYLLGSLHLGLVSLFALGFGYVGVLAIGRAWVLN